MKKTMDKDKSNLEDIVALTSTPGGKYLISKTKETTVNTAQVLMNNYKDLSHIELVALCSNLKSNFDMFMLLTGIKKELDALNEIIETQE